MEIILSNPPACSRYQSRVMETCPVRFQMFLRIETAQFLWTVYSQCLTFRILNKKRGAGGGEDSPPPPYLSRILESWILICAHYCYFTRYHWSWLFSWLPPSGINTLWVRFPAFEHSHSQAKQLHLSRPLLVRQMLQTFKYLCWTCFSKSVSPLYRGP